MTPNEDNYFLDSPILRGMMGKAEGRLAQNSGVMENLNLTVVRNDRAPLLLHDETV
jgi:hypothetical protein